MKHTEYLDSPLFWLRRAVLAMRKAIDEELHSHDLSGAQFEVLRHLWQQDQQEQRTLQERLGVTPPTLTGIVDCLVERDLVARQASAEDARVKVLSLTSAGQSIEGELGAAMERVQERLLAGFSPSEAALLKDWLRRMAANMGMGDDACA